jgi:ABC-2 type transport system ATP-binding protein
MGSDNESDRLIPMLRLDGLVKWYGDVVALDGCSFSVGRGRMIGFLGPNGAGKTTAMRAIFGLVALDDGAVTWDGQPIGQDDRLRFGYMPESRGLYPKMRARDQLVYFGRLHGMSLSGAGAAADRWLTELGLADRSGDPVEQLSHGNQQRVQLAAALIHSPELLVLDEPFSGLDPLAVETMAAILRSQAESGVAVVFSSHQLDLVEGLCEDVAIIDHGRVVMEGNVRSLQDASPHRVLEIEVDDGSRLLEVLEGVVESSVDDGRHRIVVDASTDVGALLDEARRSGEIRHFIYTTPSLSDLFREAVT